MDFNLIREIIDLLTDFDNSCKDEKKYPITKDRFITWVSENYTSTLETEKNSIN